MKLNINKISRLADAKFEVKYNLTLINSLELSEYLKNLYESKGIDISDFSNRVGGMVIDQYIYQDFFLLKDGEEYFLLDGFRRLLQEEVIDTDITVKIYDRADLNDANLVELMVGLNHHKFFTSEQNYSERGFALFFKTIFNINIPLIVKAMNGYMLEGDLVKGYSERFEKPKNTKNFNKIVQAAQEPYFFDDLRFIEKCAVNNLLIDSYFGVLVKKIRTKIESTIIHCEMYGKEETNNGKLWKYNFDDDLLNLLTNNKLLIDKIEKLPNARSQKDAHKEVMDMFESIFTKYIFNEEVELTTIEKKEIVKN